MRHINVSIDISNHAEQRCATRILQGSGQVGLNAAAYNDLIRLQRMFSARFIQVGNRCWCDTRSRCLGNSGENVLKTLEYGGLIPRVRAELGITE